MVFKPKQFAELKKFQKELAETLGKDFWTDMPEMAPFFGPRSDVYEKNDAVVVVLELPGLKNSSDVNISVYENMLVVSGNVDRDYQHHDLFQDERFAGPFERKIMLPGPVDANQTKAIYKNGLLEIVLTRALNRAQRRIDVQFVK